MPNHVYSSLTIPLDSNIKIIKGIEKEGLCRYYEPMPSELEDTVCPSDSNQCLINKYGFSNWYEWCQHHWGTKWGCYDLKVKVGEEAIVITYTTAWTPINKSIFEKFLKDFPTCEYEWEEEQGYGEQYTYSNGICTGFNEWDIPPLKLEIIDRDNEIDLYGEELMYLASDYEKKGKTYCKGFYALYDLEFFISSNLKDVLRK